MGQAIGQSLPTAVGIAISPIPIVAMVLMLATERGRTNGPAFLIGWWIGLGLVGTVVLVISGGASASTSGGPATWVSVLELVLGALLLLVAVKELRSRPRGDDAPATPKWMAALDSFTPAKAAGAGALLSALNPKNLLLAIAGAAGIASVGISTGAEVVAYVVFVLVASIGVGAPLVIYFALGDRSQQLLGELKDWLAHNNAVIMAVLLVVIGIKLIGDAISGLS